MSKPATRPFSRYAAEAVSYFGNLIRKSRIERQETAAQLAERQALIRARAAEVGLSFRLRTHVYNTFDAHRLLHWAALQGRGLELKRALLQAYHVRGENPASHEVLLKAAAIAGLGVDAAREVLARGDYADEVLGTLEVNLGKLLTAVQRGRDRLQGKVGGQRQ